MNETNPDGRVILITGATSGIGKEAAFALAKQSAHVIIHGPHAARTDSLKQEIILTCGHPAVDTGVADLFLLADSITYSVTTQNCGRHYHVPFGRFYPILVAQSGSYLHLALESAPRSLQRTQDERFC